ncbi:Hypothetical protein NTJ_07343 [Nesidiocoris tenuis]|uniref:Uncharacterized protein n=2 Tax=Nesidiocoris tenuis TaxID=355587 RepID=A0ABN7AR52_9HEMI|nr:Hypothetical protein NTJ_07343 [Nesidiocoris tenuis]
MVPKTVKFLDQTGSRKMNSNSPANKVQSWQSILKDATFRSLVKHTGFTPSLEEKIESDRLVWEKLQSSKFTRKPNAKSDDATERVKMGVLLDMTPDGGTLEFRQSDRNVYQCPDGKCDTILRRLLAIWKIERFEPSDMWVRIKVPRATKEQEDVYEYTPKYGLQEMNTRFRQSANQSVPSRQVTTTATPTTSLPKLKGNEFESLSTLPVIDERIVEVKERMDDRIADQPTPTSAETQEPFDDLLQSPTILPIVATGRYKVNEEEARIFLNQGTTVSYGFQPSDPTEQLKESHTSQPILSKRIDFNVLNKRKPISYGTKTRESNFFGRHDSKQFPGYDPYSAVQSTGLPIVADEQQYREFFLHMEPLVTEIIRDDPQVPKEFTSNQEPYDGFLPSLGPTGSPFASTVSKYAYQITHPSPEFYETPKRPNLNHFKASPLFVQYSELDPLYHGDATSTFVYEDAKQQQQHTADSTLTPAVDQHNEPTLNHTDQGLQEQVDGSVNVLRFAGTNRNEIRVPTKTSKGPNSKNKAKSPEVLEKPKGEAQKDRPITSQSEEGREPLRSSATPTETPTSTTTVQNIPTKSEMESEGTTPENMMIENINSKSPEEVVHMLTNIGVKNATRIEGYPPVSEKTLEASSKMLEKIKKSADLSDPISLIVNRVSQSYSYRTAKGKIKNFMNKRRNLRES